MSKNRKKAALLDQISGIKMDQRAVPSPAASLRCFEPFLPVSPVGSESSLRQRLRNMGSSPFWGALSRPESSPFLSSLRSPESKWIRERFLRLRCSGKYSALLIPDARCASGFARRSTSTKTHDTRSALGRRRLLLRVASSCWIPHLLPVIGVCWWGWPSAAGASGRWNQHRLAWFG